MISRGLVAAGVAVVLSLVTPAAAAEPPDARKVRKAAAAFDAGASAYREKRFEVAASHFEAADAAVRSARALRMAMRAREQAKQNARAGTLAAQARRLYPDDAKTTTLADEILGRVASSLHRVEVHCSTPCYLAVGARTVAGDRITDAVIFLAPGDASVSASFADGGDDRQVLKAQAGGKNTLRFQPSQEAPAPPPQPLPAPAPVDKDLPPPPPEPAPIPPDDSRSASSGSSVISSPIAVYSLAGLTAVLAGVTVWSGVDTVNNPGEETVRTACAGQGTDCPEYQQGLSNQLRTNVLVGVTAAVAVLTGGLALFVTDWGSSDTSATSLRIGPAGATLIGSF